MEDSVKIFSPWVTYQKKVKAFFDYDDEVQVFDLADDGCDYILTVKADTAKKAFALQKILKPEVDFGNVKVRIVVKCGEISDILEAAYDKNAIVHKIEQKDIPGGVAEYIMLEPEVIQFQNDDISSPTGDSTFLAETIGREMFDVFPYHGCICTVKIGEN